jgi:transketolase
MRLAMADIARALWGDFLERNPGNPRGFDRDRLRGGHRRRAGARFERGRTPRAVRRRVAAEAGATLSWWRYVGAEGRAIGIGRFGAAGRGTDAMAQFGFTAERIGREVGEPLDTVN